MESEQIKKKRPIKKILLIALVGLILTIMFIRWQSDKANKHTKDVIDRLENCNTVISVDVYEIDGDDYLRTEIWHPNKERLRYFSKDNYSAISFVEMTRKFYFDNYEREYDSSTETWVNTHDIKKLYYEGIPYNRELYDIIVDYFKSLLKIGYMCNSSTDPEGEVNSVVFLNKPKFNVLLAKSSPETCALISASSKEVQIIVGGPSDMLAYLCIEPLLESYYDEELWKRVGNFLLEDDFERKELGTPLQSYLIETIGLEPCEVEEESVDIIKDDSVVLFQDDEVAVRHKDVWYDISESDNGEVVYTEHKPDNTDLIEFMEHADELKYTKNSKNTDYLSDMAYSLTPHTRKTSGGTELHFIEITDFITGESWGVIPADEIREIPEDELDELGRTVLEIFEK